MTTINLKDFYPWYTHNEYIEVSEEVADELRASRLYEAAYQRRIVRNKAQYSLDCEDGIEYSACVSEPTPQELLERMELFCHLCAALNSLPETQVILSRLVDTFFSRISLTMPPAPKSHNTAYVLPWEEPLHWQSRSSGYSSS